MKTAEKIMVVLLIIIVVTTVYSVISVKKTVNPFEQECLDWVEEKFLFSKAVETGNEQLCPDEFCVAVVRKNFSYCEADDEIEKYMCLAILTGDYKYCEGIEDVCRILTPSEVISQKKVLCKEVGLITKAMVKNDLSICNKSVDKEKCREWAQQRFFGVNDILQI